MTSVNAIIPPDAQAALLLHARATACRARGVTADLLPIPEPKLGPFGGAFVTFWNGNDLRGCVGSLKPTSDLFQTISDVTRASLADRRFTLKPIVAEELNEITIEVSVLSPLEKTTDPLSLTVGQHGVYIKCGPSSGCFLPKVAAERGWSAEQFLSICSEQKAGLQPNAWKHPDTEVYLFTAQVFSENVAKHSCA